MLERLSPAFGRNDIVEAVSRLAWADPFPGDTVPVCYLPASLYDHAQKAGFDMRYYRRSEPVPVTP